ncbi:MAG TPA: hypothetical protein VIG64_10990 [Actinomycetota bacterium]|jgi:hypothetical protein
MRSLAVAAAALVLAVACTPSDDTSTAGSPSRPAAGADEIEIAATTMTLPRQWSYAVSRQAPDSWSFQMAARHSFNLGDMCDRKTGALGSLLDLEKAFVLGFAYRGEVRAATGPSAQTPGEIHLDHDTFAAYETTGCRPTYRMDFVHGGYYFTVHVALSKDAGPAIEDEVLRVLNSAADA